jgi:iduronate 2-sulfatase
MEKTNATLAIGLIFIAASFVVAPDATSAPADSKTSPNILFVVVDDLNVALGCYGDSKALTPNIDRLAKRGARFECAHVQYPLCGPSRVSFLTGRRPEATGVYVLNTPARVALPDAVQLPQFFKQNGYHAVGVGKVAHSPKTNDPNAWHHYEDGKSKDDQENEALELRYGGGDGRPRGHRLDSDGSLTRDGLNAATIRKLIADRDGDAPPFFYALGFQKPHLPWTAPKRFFEMHDATPFDPSDSALTDVPAIALQTELSGFGQPEDTPEAIRSYYACVSFIDHELGLVLDELDRQDLANNTLIVFFSDHGFHLGDHGGLWAKLSAFGQATRVPLIIAGPGVPEGIAVKTPVELIDIFPTLTDLAGFTTPEPLDGQSLRPLFDATSNAGRVAYSLVYHYDANRDRDVAGRTVISDRWRYTEWDNGRDGREFYSHADDPNEYRNRFADPSIAGDRDEAVKSLKQLSQPKPGPANRPRALLPQGTKKK